MRATAFVSICILFLIIISFRHLAASELIVTKTVYIEKGLQPDPYAIVRTNNGGYVVAGTITDAHQAWAASTDGEGKELWRYVAPLADQFAKKIGLPYPTYKGITVMPDNSIFLCGGMPRSIPNMHEAGGLLTHLDKNGSRISEVLIKPSIEKNLDGQLAACMPWDNGLIAIGNASRITRKIDINAAIPITTTVEYFYWILALNADGSAKWEKIIPVKPAMKGHDNIASLQPTSDGGFVFAAQKSGVSELVRLDSKGVVAATETFGANIKIIPKYSPDKYIRIASSDTKSLMIASLDEQLKVLDSTVEDYGKGDALGGAYLLPDNSLAIFGTKGLSGHRAIPQIIKLNPKYKLEASITLGVVGESYSIGGVSVAASDKEFVSVRRVRIPAQPEENKSQNSSPGQLMGVAMDFVKMQ